MKKLCLSIVLCGLVLGAADVAWGRPGGGGGRGGAGPRGGRPGGIQRGPAERRPDDFRGPESRAPEQGAAEQRAIEPRTIENRTLNNGVGEFRNLNQVGDRRLDANALDRNFDRGDWRNFYRHDGYGPFSAGWYADHPRAWWWGRPGANVWAAATWAGLGGWLGYDAVAPIYGSYAYDDGYTEAPTSEEETTGEGEESTAQDDTQSAEEAAQLADQGANTTVDESDFMPLGVYQVSTSDDSHPLALLQLAVSREGIIRGDYIDVMTHATQPILGAVNKETQQVAFRVGDKSQSTFETQLVGLTQEQTTALVHFASGATKRFILTRATQPEGTEGQTSQPAESSATPALEESGTR